MKSAAAKLAVLLTAAFILTTPYYTEAGALLDFIRSKKNVTVVSAAVCDQGTSEVVKYGNDRYRSVMVDIPSRGFVLGAREHIGDPANKAAAYVLGRADLPQLLRPDRKSWDAALKKAGPNAFRYYYGQEGHDCVEQDTK